MATTLLSNLTPRLFAALRALIIALRGMASTVFSNPTPRLFALRALVIASMACIVGRVVIRRNKSLDPEPPFYWISLLQWCFIIVHHVLR